MQLTATVLLWVVFVASALLISVRESLSRVACVAVAALACWLVRVCIVIAAGAHAATAGCLVVWPPCQGDCVQTCVSLHAASAWPKVESS
jgi:hypothetical protein